MAKSEFSDSDLKIENSSEFINYDLAIKKEPVENEILNLLKDEVSNEGNKFSPGHFSDSKRTTNVKFISDSLNSCDENSDQVSIRDNYEPSGSETTKTSCVKLEHVPTLRLISKIKPDFKNEACKLETDYCQSKKFSICPIAPNKIEVLTVKVSVETMKKCFVKIERLSMTNIVLPETASLKSQCSKAETFSKETKSFTDKLVMYEKNEVINDELLIQSKFKYIFDPTAEYVCYYCEKHFKKKRFLKNHIAVHMNERHFKCTLCLTSFNLAKSLERHMIKAHCPEKASKNDKHTCKFCKQTLSRKSGLNRHVRKVHNEIRPHACSLCPSAFRDKYGLKEHMQIHENKRNFKCSLCPKRFNQSNTLKKHMITHIPDRHSTNPRNFCHVCNKSHRDKWELQRHLKVHVKKEIYQCTLCPTSFKWESALKNHILLHEDEKKFKCSLCPERFNYSGALTRHMKTHDLKSEFDHSVFVCSICSNSFKSEKRLKIHLKYHEKTYPCKFCSAVFNHSSTLKIHVLSHRNERNYKCNECLKSFNTFHALRRHLEIHKNQRIHKCTLCPVSFNNFQSLRIHMVTHSSERNFVCELCEASFKLKQSYMIHKKLHLRPTKPMIHPCLICDRKFQYRNKLKAHLKSHSAEEKRVIYAECDYCKLRFTHRDALVPHMKRKHLEKIK